MRVSTPDLYDDFGDIVASCPLQFRDFGARRSFCGPIRTVRCDKDNELFRTLLKSPGQGAVIVVDGGGSLEAALMGDMLAARGRDNGWSGCLINGAVRDVGDLATIDFGIKALGTNPAKSSKTGAGAIDEPVAFGGVEFNPGEWIYCDENGVLVAPHEL